jgi:hypothetical protein
MAKPSKEELRYRLHCRIVDMVGSAIQVLVPWGSAVAIAYFVYLSLRSLVGHYTFADIGLSFLGDFKISEGLAYIFGTGGVVYGVKQKKLRERNIERTAGRIKDYETAIDPNRTSSRLTPQGRTRPEDKKR